MFDDLIATWRELGNMLADVQENYADMRPEDVIGVLHNCDAKAWGLAQDIAARQAEIRDGVLHTREVTHSGGDAGMPPATGMPIVPPVTGEGRDTSWPQSGPCAGWRGRTAAG